MSDIAMDTPPTKETTTEEATPEETTRPYVTPEGKIWPASVVIQYNEFFVARFTKEKLRSLIVSKCLGEEDGNLIDFWVLTRIDHWDHDQECTMCLTDKFLILLGFNFITEKVGSCQRIPLNMIHTMRIGNLVSRQWSFLPERNYGALQLVWGALTTTRWIDRWNPISKEIPAGTFHHHPCYYSPKPLLNKELFDCDLAIEALQKALFVYAVQPLHENIILNGRFSIVNAFYNQSNLGFCKDRNGMSF
ncbi:unnamed protein product [Calicophoron daubneyi]|uniref:HSac2 domain-containing protein n=1 Tax=Calicophoron daubneyi TaxID=300641 RepID=A0AAV2T2C6_CALDB